MLLVHRGHGLLIPIVGIGTTALFHYIVQYHSGFELGYDWTMQVSILLGSASLFALDEWATKGEENAEKISEIRASNSFFFLRTRWCAFIFLIYGLAFNFIDFGKIGGSLKEQPSSEHSPNAQQRDPSDYTAKGKSQAHTSKREQQETSNIPPPQLYHFTKLPPPTVTVKNTEEGVEMQIAPLKGKIVRGKIDKNDKTFSIQGDIEDNAKITISKFQNTINLPFELFELDKITQEDKDGVMIIKIPKRVR